MQKLKVDYFFGKHSQNNEKKSGYSVRSVNGNILLYFGESIRQKEKA